MYSHVPTMENMSASESWSTLQGIGFESCSNRPADCGRRLQKPRRGAHVVVPADPAEVLARPTYNHVSETIGDDRTARPCMRRFKSLPKLPRISTCVSRKSSASPNRESSTSGLPETPTPVVQQQSPSRSHSSVPPSCWNPSTPSSPSQSGGRGQTSHLRRQKSMAKVVIDSVGRLTSKCRSVKLNGEGKE